MHYGCFSLKEASFHMPIAQIVFADQMEAIEWFVWQQYCHSIHMAMNALESLFDNSNHMQSAASYIERHESSSSSQAFSRE